MRFLYFDRVSQIERGKRIVGTKAFSISEEFLKGHFSKVPLIPGGILLEAMAQLTGWLVVYSYDFQMSCVVSLAEDVLLPAELRPGSVVEIQGEIVDTNDNGSLCRARMRLGGETIASVGRFIFPHFRRTDPAQLAKWFRYYIGIDVPMPEEAGR